MGGKGEMVGEGQKGNRERSKSKIQNTLAIGYIRDKIDLHLLVIYYFI